MLTNEVIDNEGKQFRGVSGLPDLTVPKYS